MIRPAVLALVVLAAAPAPGVAAVPPPSLAAACFGDSGLRARSLWLRGPDGVRLYAIEAGDGPTVVVLAHQGGSSLCGELPYAKTLVASGLRVVAFDFRGYGESERPARDLLALGRDLAAAVARAHADGARVFLIGASMGGAAVVQNSGGLPVAGAVSLSGTRLWSGYGVNRPGPGALRAPFLYLGSRKDSLAPLQEARTIVRAVGSKDKRSVFYPGSLHGWQLVQDAPFAGQARGIILAWIRARA